MKNLQRRNYVVLMLLALVFACPGLAALAFYKHPQWLGSSAVNKGQLLSPAEHVPGIHAKPKWRLVLWSPNACDAVCRQQLDKLARVRLALGRRLYEVDEWLITTVPLPNALHQALNDQDIHTLLLSPDEKTKPGALDKKAHIFIANPDDYLILTYQLDDKPENIFHDLKRLLSSAEKQRG